MSIYSYTLVCPEPWGPTTVKIRGEDLEKYLTGDDLLAVQALNIYEVHTDKDGYIWRCRA